jgi:6-phosphogluconolactonase
MKLHPNIEVYQSAVELEQNAAEKFILMINKAIEERGVCFVALSGGETPRPVYRLLGTALMKDRVEWDRVHLFFTDERSVLTTDLQSNYGMINRELISHINIPPKNVHRIEGEKKPEIAAADYERELREKFNNKIVRFDVVLLGLGEDGHTASIFPGTEVVEEEKAFVAAVFVPRLDSWRVTLTLSSINNARNVLLLVSGKKKAGIVQQILKAPSPVNNLPATMVRPVKGKLCWMLDEDAAGEYVKL